MIGKDKSYLRVERRSVITHPPIPAAGTLAYPRFPRGVPLTRFTQTLPHPPAKENQCARHFTHRTSDARPISSLTFATSCNETCADEYSPGSTRPGFSLTIVYTTTTALRA